MGFNPFIRNLIIRLILLFATMITWSSIFWREDLFFNQLILLLLVSLQIASLYRYVSRTNKELSRFLNSIRDGDFTAHFNQLESEPSFAQLNRSFRGLIQKLGRQETEKNAQAHFLKALIEEIPFSILVLGPNGDLRLINHQAQETLNIPDVQNWQNLKSNRTHLLYQLVNLPTATSHLIERRTDRTSQSLSVDILGININNESLRIISIKNIESVIQQKETDAWHKLIRVLTHEIMNSITPITSITETIRKILQNHNELDHVMTEDLREAIDTIYLRSSGMLTFVKKYREISRIPQPHFDWSDSEKLMSRVIILMKNNYPEVTIQFEKSEEKPFPLIYCDESQIEQVCINLIKNACEAYDNHNSDKKVLVHGQFINDHVLFTLSDFGSGISEKHFDRIFVPFYTTKRNGSGIGLGLSRQILQNHQGTLTCTSPMSPTIFSLRLPIKLSS